MAALVTIELFSTSACNHCDNVKKRVQAMVNDFKEGTIIYRELDVLKELDYAVSLGVLSTPAIAIDGELVFAVMPSLKTLFDELQKRLT